MSKLIAKEYKRFEDIKYIREEAQNIGAQENLLRPWTITN